jgi:hypothetical protein
MKHVTNNIRLILIGEKGEPGFPGPGFPGKKAHV